MEAIGDVRTLISRIDDGLKVRKTDLQAGSAALDRFYYDPCAELKAEIARHPFGSGASFEAQMRLIYEPIAGHAHSVAMEGLDTPASAANYAFPFSLAPSDAGYWTMAYGFMLQSMKLPVGARVLEIGSGAGGLTEVLCRAGLSVTAVEPRSSNCSFVRDRVAIFGHDLETISESIDDIELDRHFDAIIFYESFHHMPAPKRLLGRLAKCLAPDGIFAFGAEPIQKPGPLIPFPWGFRMNGASLSAIRDVGWVEFGFQETYFRDMLSSLGFTVGQTRLEGFPHCDVWIARRAGA
ncbi:MAG: class I SAM-dependent methyltransferase [Brevundimonas sp.]|uniref:class I SAM-dependent methyltransferase n=1 Tax=Brevundimonas sp. TaxID=1871086 RepID=UPI00391B4AD7